MSVREKAVMRPARTVEVFYMIQLVIDRLRVYYLCSIVGGGLAVAKGDWGTSYRSRP